VTAADFMVAICAAPDDDTPRLAFADWLEEQGEAERAEFIRVQVEIARQEQSNVSIGCNGTRHGDPDGKCSWCRLRRREVELSWGCREWSVLKQPWGVGITDRGLTPPLAIFRRGFIHAITLTAADFLEHADSLCWSPRQTEEVFERGRGCKLCRGRGLMLLPEMALINLPWMELEFMPTEATYSIVEKPCQQCRIIRRQPRPCPDTAQPIREVTLTAWPDPNRYPLLQEEGGAALFAAHLAAEWEGITFHLPDQP
jgi:uncharacterized protein (TIGR02996 family)